MDQEKRKQQLRDAVKKHDTEMVDKVAVRLPKGTKEAIYSTGKSVNAYVVEAVREKMERDNLRIGLK